MFIHLFSSLIKLNDCWLDVKQQQNSFSENQKGNQEWTFQRCNQHLEQINVREHQRGNQNGQSKEIGNTGHTRQRKTQHDTICIVHHNRSKHKLLPSLVARRKLSHFNLLLRNHWANCNQTLVEWSLDDLLPKLCSVIPISNQDGHQAKNRKTRGMKF